MAGGALPLFWVKQEEMTGGRKTGWASKVEPGPFLSLKPESATEEDKDDIRFAKLESRFENKETVLNW